MLSLRIISKAAAFCKQKLTYRCVRNRSIRGGHRLLLNHPKRNDRQATGKRPKDLQADTDPYQSKRSHFQIPPQDLDTASVVNLESDPSLAGSDLLIMDINHFFAV